MVWERVIALSYSATGNTARTVETIAAELAEKLGLSVETIRFHPSCGA